MSILILGLLIFLGVHSLRIVAEGWRGRQIARHGEARWKGGCALLSLLGFVLICWGYGQARLAPLALWTPWIGGRHLASLLTLLAFVLLAAAYVPGNAIKARLGHPMILGVKVWALAHLLANHTLADLVLFGAFLLWAVLDFRSARRRPVQPAGAPVRASRTVLTLLIGLLAWAGFAFWAHGVLIGVRPFGALPA